MSFSCASVSLLVLLGAVVALGSPANYVNEELSQIHDSIANSLGLKEPVVNTDPLFSSILTSINTSCQRKEDVHLMNVTLQVYSRVFSSILKSSHRTSALLDQVPEGQRHQLRTNLMKLHKKLVELKNRLNHLTHQNPDREEVLQRLHSIQVDDEDAQKKALAEFKEIYQAASVIGSRSC